MTHLDHVQLIKKGITHKGGVWADFGSGEGAFTLALRDVAGPQVKIFSIDSDTYSLSVQKAEFDDKFPHTTITYLNKDFTKELELPLLDGIIAANSIHFHEQTKEIMLHISSFLKSNGTFVVVEYNTDHGNTWVPYPFSFDTFRELAEKTGFKNTKLLSTIPSHLLHEIYSAVTYKI